MADVPACVLCTLRFSDAESAAEVHAECLEELREEAEGPDLSGLPGAPPDRIDELIEDRWAPKLRNGENLSSDETGGMLQVLRGARDRLRELERRLRGTDG